MRKIRAARLALACGLAGTLCVPRPSLAQG